ncbi:hypothetical protein EDB87DRAFT_1115984 [Lactarius vividus]|nr:hypothetical protein EDB87DRAFT_1115984 [Lactarius vividus]
MRTVFDSSSSVSCVAVFVPTMSSPTNFKLETSVSTVPLPSHEGTDIGGSGIDLITSRCSHCGYRDGIHTQNCLFHLFNAMRAIAINVRPCILLNQPRKKLWQKRTGEYVEVMYDWERASLYHIDQVTCFSFERYMILLLLAPVFECRGDQPVESAWWYDDRALHTT